MKNNLQNWSDVFTNSFYELWNQVTQSLPNAVTAIILIIFGIIIARLLSKIVGGLLTRFSKTKMGSILSLKNSKQETIKKVDLISLFSKFTYWIVFLFFLVVASNALGWTVVSEEIGALFRYIPKLLSGIVIVIIGLYIARFVKEAILNTMTSLQMAGAKTLSSVAFYVIATFVVITALNQIGVNTKIINQNITIIIASVFIAFAVAFGYASRNVLESFISGSYSRSNLALGSRIKIKDFEGEIDRIDAVSFTLKKGNIKRVFPLKMLTSVDYEIVSTEA
ncbi:mechanosensitive ion channel family protein [Tenacibaculum maritimum]|uniref:mechanosensitive ion channel family protein n=1 Tax=Tenacibaculum maritimum TaxID=107401 RepID=UPI0012E5DA44|nr:hypothetical protein [Tenacibaculum maritimum]MCD9564210.1 hypothetical protein [Tenacibaculum maritimum]MCD9565562.1 hypothetical protein [Tenacibaculum maritimum]MCD9579185.1 hypothetical protein [Tenacibaculum maritimum]MCD9596091.1 hypothetical protein [Tenacibaculum maritimum]MCD9613340.1 hypothetical protein [Tenacibaculum maritimum]